ncbi:hypothetical protein [Massilia sp. TS11]|uniref:hypothetical protein n=1 Tax=Massilia sp. TS11 TaxID=2908003 RepID=UPI001EDAC667|nr:hypothetical protein [Massilia sp. TS11]MCG2584001.1 hypothetical protein [Massilia sp. TS11]
MSRFALCLALLALISGCASSGDAARNASLMDDNDKPEYRTGSIIAVKKKDAAKADGVKQGSAEELEQVRNNSSISTR